MCVMRRYMPELHTDIAAAALTEHYSDGIFFIRSDYVFLLKHWKRLHTLFFLHMMIVFEMFTKVKWNSSFFFSNRNFPQRLIVLITFSA